jgi:hypothetical protein
MLTRVSDGSLDKFQELLQARLKDVYGHKSVHELRSFLRTCVTNNEYYFVCSENAIGLAQKIQTRMHMRPDIEEIFVLLLDPTAKEEAKEIYRGMYQWGKMQNCKDFLLENLSDLERPEIKEVLGQLFILQTPYVKIK